MKPSLVATRVEDNFAVDVRSGLTSQPRVLQPKYFYDELGSKLFEAICALPEYYLTRCETEIFRDHADEIVSHLRGRQSLVELGSGSSIKTRYLLEPLLARQGALLYQPLDISESALAQSTRLLMMEYPELQVRSLVTDYTLGLGRMEREADGGLTVLFLGSNIGNYGPLEALAVLGKLRDSLQSGDNLLLGADLKKPAAILEPAYDDPLGVTAAFNLNLLVRINRELGADFNLRRFSHRARYDADSGRVEIFLVSREPHEVRVRDLNLTLEFLKGETIHTEDSWKFDLGQLSDLATQTGFEVVKTWTDSASYFSCNLWRVR